MESKEPIQTLAAVAVGNTNGKIGMGRGGAKRHSNLKSTGLDCAKLRRYVSKDRLKEFLYHAGVPSTEWNNDIRLKVAIEVCARTMDIMQDVVRVAFSRAAGPGKKVIIQKRDVEYVFDNNNPSFANKGRTPIYGEVKREKKRRGDGGSSDTDSVSSKNKKQKLNEEQERKEPAAIEAC